MRSTLINHFHVLRMAKSVKWETPTLMFNSYGRWHFNNYITFVRNGFRFEISCEDDVLWMTYRVSVRVDKIVVYQDGWIHNVPSEMKRQIRNTVKEIDVLNKEYKKKKLDKTYNNIQKQYKEEEKAKKLKKHEDEKRILIDKFK